MRISNDVLETYEIDNVLIKDVCRQKFLVLDVEATGLDAKKDYVTDFACVPVVNGKMLNDEAFSSFVKSPVPIPKKIEEFTGVTNEVISKAPPFREVISMVLAKYSDYIWIAQCGLEFDFPMIGNICRNENVSFGPEIIDTKVLFAFLNQESQETFSTDFLKNYFRIDSSDLKRHTALGDALLVARILEGILKEYEKKGAKDVRIKKPLSIRKFVPKKL